MRSSYDPRNLSDEELEALTQGRGRHATWDDYAEKFRREREATIDHVRERLKRKDPK